MFERILVPTDFSPKADVALRYGQAMAEQFGASLHLVHVLEEPILAGSLGTEVFLPDAQTVHEQLRSNAEAMLDDRMPADVRTRLRGTTDIRLGSCAAAVVDVARHRHIELIVVGTHARGGVEQALIGSVADAIVRKAPCPVLRILVPQDTASQVSAGDTPPGSQYPQSGTAATN